MHDAMVVSGKGGRPAVLTASLPRAAHATVPFRGAPTVQASPGRALDAVQSLGSF